MSLPRDCSRDEWPLKAYKNLDFLNSEAARNIRVLCEMTEPGLRFAEENVEDTVVLFGSARIRPLDEANKALDEVRASIVDPENPTKKEQRKLHAALSNLEAAPYYEAAVKLSESLTRWSMSLHQDHKRRFLICSGVAPASWRPQTGGPTGRR